MNELTDPRGFLVKEGLALSSKSQVTESSGSRLESIRSTLKFLDNVPEFYKQGNWSPFAHLFICSYACGLMLTLVSALEAYHPSAFISDGFWLSTFRIAFGLYCIGISLITYNSVGIWPFLSYTLTSWNLVAVRLISAFLASWGLEWFALIADLVRFPALVGCSVTFFVWWLVLFPLIDHLLKSSAAERKVFWSWNFSFTLVNVHILNLPIVLIEFIWSARHFTFFDLHMGLTVAFLYCLFYLNVLDPMGLHFYIILSPRSKLCVVSYALILVIYYAIFRGWNSFLDIIG